MTEKSKDPGPHSEAAAPSEKDRREFPRRLAHGTVICRLGHRGLGQEVRGKIKDLSPGGVGIIVPTPIETGLELELELIGVGSAKSVHINGVVRLCFPADAKNFRVGIRFEKRLPYDAMTHLTY